MLDSLFGGSALNCLYGAALLVGFLYALFLLFFQGISHAFDVSDIDLFGHHIDFGDLFDFGHDADLSGHAGLHVEHDGGEASGLSMLAISGFVTAFGAFGLVTEGLLSAGPVISLLAAITGGVLVGGAAQLFFINVLRPTTSTNIELSTLKGRAADVTVPITVSGLGQIATIIEGQRVTLSARSSAQIEIARGTAVTVDSIRDGVAYVSLPDDSQPEFVN
ncbi:MAG: hypothetical protein JW910_09855 [Anaerolineae bacterium]|nr:hypothetical protein [Anaerolineae bacterium]